jgi:hypothetical protein
MRGQLPEWPNGADCKSAVYDFGGSNPPLPTNNLIIMRFDNLMIESSFKFWGLIIGILPNYQIIKLKSGSSSFGRAIAFQAIGGQFEPGLPLTRFVVYCL